MIDFLRKLFGQTSPSSATAKDRLRLVLMTDHLELAPDMIEAMKRDLVDVISRYVEVDRDKIEVNFEQQDKALAMLANIPILAVNRNGSATTEPAPATAQAVPVPTAPLPAPEPAGPELPAAQAVPEEVQAQAEPQDAQAPVVPGAPKRRRRRKRKAKSEQPTAAAAP